MSDEAPRILAQRYELLREIARGGMAEVYLARDTKLDRVVAVKILASELSRDPRFVERFRREAQAAANLAHPNIVSVFDWGQQAGTSFIVMEYVEGRSLRDVLRHEGTLPPVQAADIGAEIAAALSFAHGQGVVHRDVKPANVLITPAGQVKVTDFGIARAGVEDGLTQTGSVMGTATYFSPEQAQGLPVDGRSDVYALGIVLYEMLTGAPPFSGDNPVAVAYQQVREPVPPPRLRNPSIPPDLERIVLTALAKDPNARYQRTDDLRADLLRFRRGQAVIGGPVTAIVTAVDPTTSATAVAGATVAAAAVDGAGTRQAPRGRGKGPVIAIVALVIALAAVVIGLLVSQLGGGGGSSVAVPDVTKQTVQAATQTLTAKGFKVRVDRLPNDQVAKGIVYDQDPVGGTKMDEGETVLLRVSDGAGSVTMPDVSGDQFEDADATLTQLGLQVARVDQPDDSAREGTVIKTKPKAGRSVEKGSTVQVIVSSGPPPVTVPDVAGQDQVAATQALANAGFVVQKTLQPSATVPPGAVISTSPAGGQQAKKGSTVQMVVSSGPDQTTVPNVVGESRDVAVQALQDLGLQVTVLNVASTSANDGKVIVQSPTAGTAVSKGSRVTITVGTGPVVPTTTTTGSATP